MTAITWMKNTHLTHPFCCLSRAIHLDVAIPLHVTQWVVFLFLLDFCTKNLFSPHSRDVFIKLLFFTEGQEGFLSIYICNCCWLFLSHFVTLKLPLVALILGSVHHPFSIQDKSSLSQEVEPCTILTDPRRDEKVMNGSFGLDEYPLCWCDFMKHKRKIKREVHFWHVDSLLLLHFPWSMSLPLFISISCFFFSSNPCSFRVLKSPLSFGPHYTSLQILVACSIIFKVLSSHLHGGTPVPHAFYQA